MNSLMRKERQLNRWTQGYVAIQVGITKAALANIERGIRKPSYEVTVKLQNLFGKPIDYLLSVEPPADHDSRTA